MVAPSDQTEVVIAGGGPAGLSLAALLGHHGVDTVLVERRAEVNPHPRARSVNVRTAEIFRLLGILDEVEAVSLPRPWTEQMIYTDSLAGREIGRTAMAVQPVVAGETVSPAPWLLSSQDQIEPIIARRAAAYPGVELRFATELTGLERGPDRVAVRVDGADGGSSTIEARYLVGADGASSFVRRWLGIPLIGPTDLATLINCHFKADLDRWTADRPAALYWTTEPARNVFQKIDVDHRWLCQIGYDPRQHDPREFDRETAARWIRASIGAGDGDAVEIEVHDVIPWTMSSTVAERLADDEGTVFLVGDAAHQLPPSGGFGMNTAIQDAHNLAWKLAYVIAGRAGPALLDTYHRERAPIARYNADRSLDNTRSVGRIRKRVEQGGDGAAVAEAVAAAGRYGNWLGMDLGLHYEEGCLIPDGSPLPPVADPVSDYRPTARPGHRAPHVPLADGGSSLDLYDRRFTLLVGDGLALADLDRDRVQLVPIDRLSIADPAAEGVGAADGWRRRHGIERSGALLVRPDGHVAWRQPSSVTAADVTAALDRLGISADWR